MILFALGLFVCLFQITWHAISYQETFSDTIRMHIAFIFLPLSEWLPAVFLLLLTTPKFLEEKT